MKVLVPLAHGFEEIEAVTIIDVLRRAGLEVATAFLDKNPVTGAHNIAVTAERNIGEIKDDEYDALVLPGGMPGSRNLKENSRVVSLVRALYDHGRYVTAICAAPIVLEEAGILKGKKATCFPGYEKGLSIDTYLNDPVVVDENIVTGRGPGCAIPFALKLVELFLNERVAEELKKSMQVYWM